jgi:PAP2 superfamily
VQTVALTWQQALEVGAALAATGAVLRFSGPERLRRVAPFAVEAAVIAALYAIWQRAGELSVGGTGPAGGLRRAEWIARVERDWHLPSERSVQDLVLGHPLVVQTANLYYATMHFGVLFAFLIWLFVRHRDRYKAVRTILAFTTLLCLVIQFIPVAPPRLLPGYVDTANRYGQSVYGNFGFGADELSAMPSVHVAWAVLIGWYVARISTSRWRWVGVVHAAATVFIVVCTANHWWLDGIVGVAVLAVCAWARFGWDEAWRVWRQRRNSLPPPVMKATETVPH